MTYVRILFFSNSSMVILHNFYGIQNLILAYNPFQRGLMSKLNIFEYLDYRKFLNDYYFLKKEENPHFSYGVWSKKLDIKSSATICKILTDIRPPSNQVVKRLMIYFDFTEKERKHFLLIVKLSSFIVNQGLKSLKVEAEGITINY